MLILIDTALKKDGNLYPQVFLKECKFIQKCKNVVRYLIYNLEMSSDDSEEK